MHDADKTTLNKESKKTTREKTDSKLQLGLKYHSVGSIYISDALLWCNFGEYAIFSKLYMEGWNQFGVSALRIHLRLHQLDVMRCLLHVATKLRVLLQLSNRCM